MSNFHKYSSVQNNRNLIILLRGFKWIAWLWPMLPIRSPFVSAVGVGGSFEQMRMYIEIIPSEAADVMSEAFKHISYRRGSVNDSIGYESLNDAIVAAENIGASLLCNVKPENLLFVFGQTIESIGYAPMECPLPPPAFNDRYSVGRNGNDKHRARNYECEPKHRAIVLCKLKHSDELEKLLAGKEKNGGHDTKRYEIAWCELQELKKRLGSFS